MQQQDWQYDERAHIQVHTPEHWGCWRSKESPSVALAGRCIWARGVQVIDIKPACTQPAPSSSYSLSLSLHCAAAGPPPFFTRALVAWRYFIAPITQPPRHTAQSHTHFYTILLALPEQKHAWMPSRNATTYYHTLI